MHHVCHVSGSWHVPLRFIAIGIRIVVRSSVNYVLYYWRVELDNSLFRYGRYLCFEDHRICCMSGYLGSVSIRRCLSFAHDVVKGLRLVCRYYFHLRIFNDLS